MNDFDKLRAMQYFNSGNYEKAREIMDKKIKDIYILHVDNNIAFYKHSRKCPAYGYAPQEKFIDFVKSIRETYPDYRLRCIRNVGIENWLRAKINQPIIRNKQNER